MRKTYPKRSAEAIVVSDRSGRLGLADIHGNVEWADGSVDVNCDMSKLRTIDTAHDAMRIVLRLVNGGPVYVSATQYAKNHNIDLRQMLKHTKRREMLFKGIVRIRTASQERIFIPEDLAPRAWLPHELFRNKAADLLVVKGMMAGAQFVIGQDVETALNCDKRWARQLMREVAEASGWFYANYVLSKDGK